MTNKPMLSVERDERADFEKEVQAKAERFQPDFRRYGLHPDADYKCANNQWAWELWQKRASMDKPAVQRQGEPVGYVPDFQVESFLAKRGRSFSVCPAEWSNIEKDMPLYAEQPAPVAVVMAGQLNTFCDPGCPYRGEPKCCRELVEARNRVKP